MTSLVRPLHGFSAEARIRSVVAMPFGDVLVAHETPTVDAANHSVSADGIVTHKKFGAPRRI